MKKSEQEPKRKEALRGQESSARQEKPRGQKMPRSKKTPRGQKPPHGTEKPRRPMTEAPLFHTLQLLAAGDSARFHIPGHKGEPVFNTFSDVFSIDYTETYGTGNLYTGAGPIRDAEKAAARYWGAADCFFLTGGATQGIYAMLATAVGCGSSVLFDRSCHRSVCHACALLDITPYFLSAPFVEPFSISGELSVAEAERMLKLHPDIEAVLLTSPSYYGIRQDLASFAKLCEKYDICLLVDAAHGAHFPALDLPMPVAEGADMAVVSAHKTLPSMGQGAVILFSNRIPPRFLRENTLLFGTSSPSYPIMASIDLARAYMEGPGRNAYRRAAETCAVLSEMVNDGKVFHALTPQDYPLLDPCRLVVCAAGTNTTGDELADDLWSKYGVACEMSDSRNVVFVLTGQDSSSAVHRLEHGLQWLSKKRHSTPPPSSVWGFPPAERVLSVRNAWFSDIRPVSLENAIGHICARPVTPYPPGVPLLWPGEKISRAHVELMRERWYNEFDSIYIVRR